MDSLGGPRLPNSTDQESHDAQARTSRFATSRGATPRAPIVQAFAEHGPDMLRVACMSLMNVIPVVTTVFGAAYAIQPA